LAISKQRKNELVELYIDMINKSNAFFLTEYTGQSVKDLQKLRGEIREIDGTYLITKNTLLRHAFEKTGKPVPADLMVGQLATGFALGEAPALAKMLSKYSKSSEQFAIKFGVMDDVFLTAEQVEDLANLPSLDELRAQLIGIIQAPARNIASVFASGVRQVVNVLDAYAIQESDAEAAAG
jgi:large subunit ribosomal protein L10